MLCFEKLNEISMHLKKDWEAEAENTDKFENLRRMRILDNCIEKYKTDLVCVLDVFLGVCVRLRIGLLRCRSSETFWQLFWQQVPDLANSILPWRSRSSHSALIPEYQAAPQFLLSEFAPLTPKQIRTIFIYNSLWKKIYQDSAYKIP